MASAISSNPLSLQHPDPTSYTKRVSLLAAKVSIAATIALSCTDFACLFELLDHSVCLAEPPTFEIGVFALGLTYLNQLLFASK